MSMNIVVTTLVVATMVACTTGGKVVHKDVPGIKNFSHIEHAKALPGPKVGFGGATEPAAMPWLAQQGYAAVINLRHSPAARATA